MYGLILTLLTLNGFLLVLVVLLQSGKGGGLAAEFGGASSSADTLLGGRQAATLLTKASWITGGLFIGLSLMLAILSARDRAPSSILEGELGPGQVQEAPTPLLDRELEGALEDLVEPRSDSSLGAEGQDEGPPQGGN